LIAIGTVAFPRIAGASVSGRGSLLTQGTRLSFAIGVGLGLVVAVLTPVAIPLLFGKAFAGSVAVGIVLVFAAVILGMNIVMEEGIRGLGQTATVFWAEATGLVVTVVALWILLRPLGIMGAGIATFLGYSATAVVLLRGVCIFTGQSLRAILLIEAADWRIIQQKLKALQSHKKGTSA
jgi:O-antigen/teichoic acid export membrane protein